MLIGNGLKPFLGVFKELKIQPWPFRLIKKEFFGSLKRFGLTSKEFFNRVKRLRQVAKEFLDEA